MSFVAPVFLVAAGLLAAGVVVLHYIVMRQPPRDVLPTARFIPIRPAVVRTWARWPENLLLLLLRTVAILLLGAAFARPVWHRRRVVVAHVVLADRSRAVRDAGEVADSARRLLTGSHDVLVAFDSTPSTIGAHPTDSLARLTRRAARGNLSAALIAAFRSATRAEALADSLEVVLVSPVTREEVDAATDSIRARWPGAVRLVRVAAYRDTLNPAARLTVRWPDSTRARTRIDTATAVVAEGVVVVAPFERRWVVDTVGATVVARWLDGEPAAVEQPVADGCLRHVVVPVPVDGDLTLRPEFERLARLIHRPCGKAGRRVGGDWLVDSTRPVRTAAPLVMGDGRALMGWLIGAVMALLLIELGLRELGTRA